MEVFYKKVSWKFRKIHKKRPELESLFNKVAKLRPAALLNPETPALVFSSEFWEIFKITLLQNTSFY